jgi:GDP-L-fucose synthase
MKAPLRDRDARVFVAGHRGLVGSAILRRLKASGFGRVLTRDRAALDLRDPAAVESFFAREKPEHVFLAAAKVGGIHANSAFPADFIAENLSIQGNVIEASLRHKVKRLLFLGSSCIYPRLCPQPMKEEHLLTGPLEPTNEPYAVAKIAGIVMCRAFNRQHGTDFLSVMPTNLYGPGDNFNLETSHVLPALLRKFHEAKERGAAEVEVWGSGSPLREFLHVDDMADACLFLMGLEDAPDLVNVGSGEEVSIRLLAESVGEAVGFKGRLRFDASKPDGTPRKLLDSSRLRALGWKAKVPLREGLASTYRWFVENHAGAARR